MGVGSRRGGSATRIHYGWVIVSAGALTLFACMGLGRFAFSMILPSMGKGLLLGYDQMGYLGTGNFAGYLASVAAAPWILKRFGARRTIAAALVLIGVCLLLIGRSRSFGAAFSLYLLAGVGSGLANVPMIVLAGHWVANSLRGRAIGLMLTGSGIGIIFSGFLVPVVNRSLGAEGWRLCWAILGAIVLFVAFVAFWFLRDSPRELGLEPLGAGRASVPNAKPAPSSDDGGMARVVLRLGGLYLLFGATYMIYGTFIVTSMVKEYGLAEASAGRFWAWVGFFSMFSGPLFGGLSDRLGRKWGIAMVFSVQTLAYGLAGAKLGVAALYVSVTLYGLAFSAIPTIMGAAVVDYLGAQRAAAAFSAVTFFFATGQTFGPAVAGIAAKATGTFSTSFLAAAVLTTIGAVFATRLPRPSRV